MKVVISVHAEPGYTVKEKIIWKGYYYGQYYGIKNLLDLDFKLSLFMMPEFLTFKEKDKILDVLDDAKKEHEIGLHLHPDDSFLVKNFVSDGKYKALWFYDYDYQRRMIDYGKRCLERELNLRIKSFISGKWSENNDTIKALIDTGFTHDATPNRFKSKNCDWSRIGRFRAPYNPNWEDYQEIGDLPIVMVPVSKTITNAPLSPEVSKGFMKMQKNAFLEYLSIDFPVFHMTLHSSSMTNKDGKKTVYYKNLKEILEFIKNFEIQPSVVKEVRAYNKDYKSNSFYGITLNLKEILKVFLWKLLRKM